MSSPHSGAGSSSSSTHHPINKSTPGGNSAAAAAYSQQHEAFYKFNVNPADGEPSDICIVGLGLIGGSIAHTLQQQQRAPRSDEDCGGGKSGGNAGGGHPTERLIGIEHDDETALAASARWHIGVGVYDASFDGCLRWFDDGKRIGLKTFASVFKRCRLFVLCQPLNVLCDGDVPPWVAAAAASHPGRAVFTDAGRCVGSRSCSLLHSDCHHRQNNFQRGH
jgi:hypothetical protein